MSAFVLNRRGVTLVELLVVLMVLGLMAGVVGLSWRSGSRQTDGGDNPIAAARQRAFESGATARIQVTTGVPPRSVTIAALPDGRVLATDLSFDPLTGMPASADTTHE